MSGTDWRRLSPLLDELIDLPDHARERRLAELAETEPAMAREVQRLLDLDRRHPDFLADPAVATMLGHPLVGRMIGPYRLEREIGEGGMGQVWLAERADGLYERRVALKLLRPGLASADLKQRFQRERQILARLAHAHIARFLDAGVSDDGQPYLALEYIQGEPITVYARRQNASVADRVRLLLQVCAAVSHAHASLVVHRDLKPSNILVTSAGDVRLLDFGIAKLLDTPSSGSEHTLLDARAFTLHYAAPEQLAGEPVGTMTDVYSLGVVFYELLTGFRPYRVESDTDAAWQAAILESDAIRPSLAVLRPQAMSVPGGGVAPSPDARLARQLAGDIDTIVLKALHKVPARRYASIEALAQDLQRYLEGRPILARPAGVGYRFCKYLRRHGLALAAGVGVFALLSTSLAVAVWQAREAISEAARAQAMQGFVVSLFEGDHAPASQAMDLRGLLQAGLERAGTDLVDEPVSQVAMLGLIARLLNNIGDHDQALDAIGLQTLALAKLGEADRREAQIDAWIEQARAHRGLGQTQACEALFEADANPELLGPEYTAARRADLMSEKARCLRLTGRTREVRDLLEHALELRQTDGDNRAQAESLIDLAAIDADAGLPDEAIAGLRRALDRLRVAEEDDGPLAVAIWRNLGMLYRERGDLTAAEGAAREALVLSMRRHGPDHPATAESQLQFAEVLMENGDLDGAERMTEVARSTLVARFGEQHPDLGAIYETRAAIAFERGDAETSEAELRRAIAIWSATPDPMRLPGARLSLGRILMVAGRPEAAEAEFRAALDGRRGVHGDDHAAVGSAWRFIGEAQAARGDWDAAETSLIQAVALMNRHFGPHHPACGAAELSLARAMARVGRVERARELVRDVANRFVDEGIAARKLRWRAEAVLGELECVVGDPGGRDRIAAVMAGMPTPWPSTRFGHDIESLAAFCPPDAG